MRRTIKSGVMVNGRHINSSTDEIIFSAEYCPFKVCISAIIPMGFFLLIVLGAAYFAILDSNYIGAGLLLFLGACAVKFVLAAIFFGKLLFCQDRVVKVSHFFKPKTIYYASAVFSDPGWGVPFCRTRVIFDSDSRARPVRWRLPISYEVSCFASDTAKNIEIIIDYLTEDQKADPRRFRKSALPKDIIFQMK